MDDFVIEDGILIAHLGHDRVVIVPDGVKQIGGEICNATKPVPKSLRGDAIGYKAFYMNTDLEELYLPDSVEIIGFKCLENCDNLRVLAFSNNVKEIGCNALLNCDSLKTIKYKGTMFEFSNYRFEKGSNADYDQIICTDGTINLHQDYYIDTLYFPGTREEWDKKYNTGWRAKRIKNVVCQVRSV